MGNCDLPKITIDSFIEHISDPYETVIDAIFWLGDNAGHDVYGQTQSNHLDTTVYIT